MEAHKRYFLRALQNEILFLIIRLLNDEIMRYHWSIKSIIKELFCYLKRILYLVPFAIRKRDQINRGHDPDGLP